MIRKIALAATYRYGLKYRPPGVGAVPKGYLDYSKDNEDIDSVRHGILTYDRELTLNEVKSYELLPLSSHDGKPLELPKFPEAVVRKVIHALNTLTAIREQGSEEDEDFKEDIDKANATIEIFRKYARSKHLDADKALSEIKRGVLFYDN